MALIGRPTSSCEVGLPGDAKARVSASRAYTNKCVLLTGGESIAATLARICMALIGRPTSSCEVGLPGDTMARVSASRWGRGLVQGQ